MLRRPHIPAARTTALLLFLLASGLSPAHALTPSDSSAAGWSLFPGNLAFLPLTANDQEPKVGLRKEMGASKLKLDIGSSIDFLEFRPDTTSRLRLGAEFFTYALTSSVVHQRLQVIAVDGYFGGHISYTCRTGSPFVAFRLRIVHQSGHLVDGDWDTATMSWMQPSGPVPYTRNFGELTASASWNCGPGVVMAYSGVSYSTLVRPSDLARWSTLHGVEVHSPAPCGHILDKPIHLFAADHLTFAGVPTYYGSNNLEFGVKCGTWEGQGFRLYVNYSTGLDSFSQFYSVRSSQWGVGFTFDFW